MLSLRAHVLLGAILWTTGLFAMGGVVMTHLVHWHPAAPRIFHGFFMHHMPVAIVALACMAAGLSQVRRGLGAVTQMRTRLSAVHAGRERRVAGSYPTEVQPLVDDLNALLDHREQMVRRALTKAGDLAHGLKTPLSILAQEAERADEAGHHDTAAAIGHEVERMRRQIEYHLAHARAAASGAMPGARCSVLESASALSRTLLRLYADRGLTIDVKAAPGHAVRGQREDLDEMLGNLLENACKWARTHVTVTSEETGGVVLIAVDDDGPGLVPSMRDAVLQRGVRADEAAPGSGFGLAIVRDLAELYGGAIALRQSPEGGLQARLTLPGCQ